MELTITVAEIAAAEALAATIVKRFPWLAPELLALEIRDWIASRASSPEWQDPSSPGYVAPGTQGMGGGQGGGQSGPSGDS